MMGNYQVRFLGERVAVMPLSYPTDCQRAGRFEGWNMLFHINEAMSWEPAIMTESQLES